MSRVVDERAGDVGRQQVGRELNAVKGGVEAARDGEDGERLTQSGDAFDEHVVARNEGRQQASEQSALADNHLAELLTNCVHPYQIHLRRRALQMKVQLLAVRDLWIRIPIRQRSMAAAAMAMKLLISSATSPPPLVRCMKMMPTRSLAGSTQP